MDIANRFLSKGIRKALGISLAVILILLTACTGKEAAGPAPKDAGTAPKEAGAAPKEEKPLKVGVLASMSGPFANTGEGLKKGYELYLDMNNRMVGNRKVEMIYEDDEANPQVALRKLHKLIDQDKVDLITGFTISNTLYAVRDEIDSRKVPTIVTGAAGNAVNYGLKSDSIYRVSSSGWMLGYATGAYALKLGKKAYVISYDNPAGYEQVNALTAAMEAGGGQVLKVEYPKPGTSDFATIMTQIAQSKPDVVLNVAPGGDSMRFVMQFKEFGLKDKIPLITGTPPDLATTPEMVQALEGSYSRYEYKETSESAPNKTFVEGFKKKFGDAQLGYELYAYDAFMVLAEAVKKANGGKAEDLLKALSSVDIETPRGKVTMDPKTHNVILNVQVFKYEVKNGKLVKNYVDEIRVQAPDKDPDKK